MKRIILSVCLFLVISLVLATARPISTRASSQGDLNVTQKQIIQPTSLVSLQDGGKQYTYTIDGVTMTFPIPPKGFSPLTASNEQLKKYGFSERPTDPDGLKLWNDLYKNYKENAVPNITKDKVREKYRAPAMKKDAFFTLLFNGLNTDQDVICTDYSSQNWSGYEVYESPSALYYVWGDFIQSRANASSLNNSMECSWVGLGGDPGHFANNNTLLQCGTVMTYVNKSAYYNAWYEWVGGAQDISMTPFPMNINPGDAIHNEVRLDNGVIYFQVFDETSGVVGNFKASRLSDYYTGVTAEWIDERPFNDNTKSYRILADYGSIKWVNCRACGAASGWKWLNQRDYNRLIMTNDNGQTLSYPPAAPGQSSFIDQFVKAQ